MKNKTKRPLIPRLRFPEFKDAGPWEVKRLGEVGEIITGTTPSTKNTEYYKNGIYPWITPTDIGESKNIHDSKIKLSEKGLAAGKFIPENSLLVTCIASIGKNAILRSDGSCNQQINAITNLKNTIIDFLYYLIEKNVNVLLNVAGQGGMAILNKNDFSKLKFAFPVFEEQQKIADCLSSLDEVIELHEKKLKALKQHKKGLMQQLFPQEGETIPRLRFPEFKDAGPWEVKRLGEVGKIHSSIAGKTAKDFGHGSAQYVPYMNVFSNTFIDIKWLEKVDIAPYETQTLLQRGDVLFTVSSETPDEAGMSSVILDDVENCYANSFCTIFRPSIYIFPVFLGYLLRAPIVRAYFSNHAQGATRFNLSKEAFRKLPLLIPDIREQQKIAECLSSLDEVIELHEKKLKALKTFKKGLMQQLFPQEVE